MNVLSLRNVTVEYREWRGFKLSRLRALDHVSFSLEKGERVAVIGESGAGKTTLIKTILGLLRPVEGKVLVLGTDIYKLPKKKRHIVTVKIGYVPQSPGKALNPKLKVKTTLLEALEKSKVSEEEALKRVEEAIRLVNLDPSVLEMYPDQLSGGMQQRILIARSLVNNPELILLDEPTSALDVSTQAQIINLLNIIHEKLKPALLLVTHDLPVAQYLADRVIVLYRGRIVEENTIDELIRNPQHSYTRLLIESYL